MTRNVPIKLTWCEVMLACDVGCMRRIHSIKDGLNKNKHAMKSDWATDIDGAAAEMVMAQYLGVYWEPSINTFKKPDVGGYQVRSTTYKTGCLIVRDNDEPHETFVLVTCDAPNYRLIGSIKGSDAKIDEFRKIGSNGEADCWWVPQDRLADLPTECVQSEAAA